MTKQEIEKAIENGESVWINGSEHKLNKYYFVAEYNNEPTLYLMTCGYEEDDWDNYLVEKITNICKTKAEAEHYLHHANITRTERLPFLTWEEFVGNKKFYFYDASFVLSKLSINDEKIVLSQAPDSGEWDILKPIKEWDLTEANFYKAYDECVRLFKGDNK